MIYFLGSRIIPRELHAIHGIQSRQVSTTWNVSCCWDPHFLQGDPTSGWVPLEKRSRLVRRQFCMQNCRRTLVFLEITDCLFFLIFWARVLLFLGVSKWAINRLFRVTVVVSSVVKARSDWLILFFRRRIN